MTYHYFFLGAKHAELGLLAAARALRQKADRKPLWPGVVVTPWSLSRAIELGLYVRSADMEEGERFKAAFEIEMDKLKVKRSARIWKGARRLGEGSGDWHSVEPLTGDVLAAAGGVVGAATARAQTLKGLTGKRVERLGHVLEIRKASKKGVSAVNVATGEAVSMGAEEFLSRRIRPEAVPAGWSKPMRPVSIPDRALSIARSQLHPIVRLRDLYVLRRQAARGSDGERACTHYISLLKQGKKIVRWEPDEKTT